MHAEQPSAPAVLPHAYAVPLPCVYAALLPHLVPHLYALPLPRVYAGASVAPRVALVALLGAICQSHHHAYTHAHPHTCRRRG